MARSQQDDVKKRLIELTTERSIAALRFADVLCRQGNVLRQGQLRDVEEEIVEQTQPPMPQNGLTITEAVANCDE